MLKTRSGQSFGRKARAEDATALEAAIRFVSRSERFEQEVRSHLEAFPTDQVDEAIERLRKQNILNDDRAAEAYCRARSGRKAVGSHRLAYELRQKGASEEVISKFCESDEDSARAVSLLRGKFRTDPDLQQKGFRFLLSRGFNYDTANRAARDYFTPDV